MAASILQIGISRNLICDNLVDFPKSGHKLVLLIHVLNAPVVCIMLLVCNLLRSIRHSFLHMIKVALYSVGYQVVRVLENVSLTIL